MALTINGKKVLGYALGGTEFYSIDSSDTSVTASGKKFYAIPSKITIKAGTSLFVSENYTTDTALSDTVVDCVGTNDDKYFFAGYVSFTHAHPVIYSYDTVIGRVAKSDCKNIVW